MEDHEYSTLMTGQEMEDHEYSNIMTGQGK
jgi:hypothetical protein